jgi:cation transport ATPase
VFLVGLVRRAGGVAWAADVIFAGCYVCGGWEPGLAGLRALRAKSLDVDLLMVVAAGIGQVVDGALLIVIFSTSGGPRGGLHPPHPRRRALPAGPGSRSGQPAPPGRHRDGGFAFDKTGTLTCADPRLDSVRPVTPTVDEDAVLAWAAAAEYPSEHPWRPPW